MNMLATKIGDITIESLFIGAVTFVITGGVCLWVWMKAKERENLSMPQMGKVAKLVDLQNYNDIMNWATFETQEGERVRLLSEASKPYLIGDEGYLKWQGNRLISFNLGKVCDNGETWICSACGTENHVEMNTCTKCHVTKSWSDAQN